MSLMIRDMQLLKSYNKIWEKIEKLMKIYFNTETTYGDDDDKYIKTKIKTHKDSIITNFYSKNGSKKNTRIKSTTQMFINNNFRFCYLCI